MRFWPLWRKTYAADPMLHLFCGASTDGETRVDVRPEAKGANVVGDFRAVQLEAGRFASAFADPPYTEQYAAEWGQKFPRPSEILKVMRDAVRDGGTVGVLHLQVLRPVTGLRAVAYHPVFCGTTKHIRCLSVFKKMADGQRAALDALSDDIGNALSARAALSHRLDTALRGLRGEAGGGNG